VTVTRFIVGITATVGLVFATPVAAFAVAYGGVQGYAAETPLGNGTIVELTGKNSNTVKTSTKKQLQNMFGVTIDRNLLPVTLSGKGLKNHVFVAVSGNYDVLVSDEAGPIAPGDYVTLSSVDGVAMKAGTEKTVFGRANGSFDGNGVLLSTATLKDESGKTSKRVQIGSVPVTIDIRSNPNEKSTKTDLPEFLQRLGQAIAEKEVSPIRMYLSMAITAVSLVASIAVLYSGVRNSVISIGRNPMSKKSIFRALLEIILTSLLILIVGLFAVYLLLRL